MDEIKQASLTLHGQHFGDVNTSGAAVDLGGSLAKVVTYRVLKEETVKTELEMQTFEDRMKAIDFVSEKSDPAKSNLQTFSKVTCTGVGSVMLQDLLRERFGDKLMVETEEGSLSVKGFSYLFSHLEPDQFLQKVTNGRCIDKIVCKFPCIFVIIGTMAVVYKLEDSESYQRIGGSNRAGRTFTGLGKLLTNAETYSELLQLAHTGSTEHLDLTIGDLTGLKAYEADSAPLRFVASYFGKATENDIHVKGEYKREDLARSLLECICTDLGHLSILYGKAFDCSEIYMAGSFIGDDDLTMNLLSSGSQMWSYEWGDMRPRFVKYGGYMTAVGALVKRRDSESFNNR